MKGIGWCEMMRHFPLPLTAGFYVFADYYSEWLQGYFQAPGYKNM